jgi:hypothetical protein
MGTVQIVHFRFTGNLDLFDFHAMTCRAISARPYYAALTDVKGIGAKTFQQAAGFLRVPGAADALELTGVHPVGLCTLTPV